jgi:hypothetical protein
VGGDQLLLLSQRVEEAEGVRAEPDHRNDGEQRERAKRARRYAYSLAPRRWCEHHEREHEPGRGLHAHAGHEHSRCRWKIGGHAHPIACPYGLPVTCPHALLVARPQK